MYYLWFFFKYSSTDKLKIHITNETPAPIENILVAIASKNPIGKSKINKLDAAKDRLP